MASCGRKAPETSASLMTVDVAYPVVDSVTIYKSYPGQLSAGREVKLMARVNGYLVSQDYKGGDFVKQGTVLFRIEDRNYRDAVQRAQASLEEAKANRQYASTRYNAMVEALKGDAVSEMEVAQAKSNLAECDAAVKTAAAALQTASTQLSYCTVRAPFDGHVSTNTFDVGAYISGEGAPVELATIYADREMLANFAIEDNASLGKLRQNLADGMIDFDSIPIKFSEPTAYQYSARLKYLAPDVDTSTGTLAMQASVDNTHGELRSGMFVSVDLPVENNPKALMVKDAAISTDQLGKYVYVVNDSDKVVYTPVEVGPQVADTMRIVTKGLSKNDRYVTKALLKVRDGITVKPIVKP